MLQGDSGGPVFVKKTNGEAILLGVIAKTASRARTGVFADVHMEVSKFLAWITDAMTEMENAEKKKESHKRG